MHIKSTFSITERTHTPVVDVLLGVVTNWHYPLFVQFAISYYRVLNVLLSGYNVHFLIIVFLGDHLPSCQQHFPTMIYSRRRH